MPFINNAFGDFFGSSFYTELDALKSMLPKFPAENAVVERDVVLSHLILDCIEYRNMADLFLGCACVNLLGRYANTDHSKSRVKYDFKMYLGEIIDGIANVNNGRIRIGYDAPKDSGMYLIVSFDDFQFSYWYQCNRAKALGLFGGQPIPWDGFRKQPIASEILRLAFENMGISGLTQTGRQLREVVEEGLRGYENGSLRLVSGILAKAVALTPQDNPISHSSKNYFRAKLREACGKLVLLRAKFIRAHEHYITFVSIKPYMRGVETTTVCNHLNVFNRDIEGIVDANTLKANQEYCIAAYCAEYQNGSGRMGIRIAKDVPHSPIVPIDDVWMIPRSTFNRSYRFKIEEYLKPKQLTSLQMDNAAQDKDQQPNSRTNQ